MKHYYAFVVGNIVEEVIVTDSDSPPITTGGNWINVTYLRPLPQRGWKYTASQHVFKPQSEQHILLEAAKVDSKRVVDAVAGDARSRHFTIIPGQQEVYNEKFHEAIDYIMNNQDSKYPDEDFPLLLVETAIRDISMKDFAQEVIQTKKYWTKKMASIEMLRLGAKYEIDKCDAVAEINRLKGLYIHKLNKI